MHTDIYYIWYNRKNILARNRKILNENLQILQKWLTKHKNIFQFIPPQAGGMAFLKYSSAINSTELSNKLRETKDVFILPGDCFGMDKFIRIGIGGETNHFSTGLQLLDEGLKDINSYISNFSFYQSFNFWQKFLNSL